MNKFFNKQIKALNKRILLVKLLPIIFVVILAGGIALIIVGAVMDIPSAKWWGVGLTVAFGALLLAYLVFYLIFRRLKKMLGFGEMLKGLNALPDDAHDFDSIAHSPFGAMFGDYSKQGDATHNDVSAAVCKLCGGIYSVDDTSCPFCG